MINQAWASCLNYDRIWVAAKKIFQTFQEKSLATPWQSDIYFSFMFVKYCSSHPWTLGYFLPLFHQAIRGELTLVPMTPGWMVKSEKWWFISETPSSGMPLEPCWKRLWVGIPTCFIVKQSCSLAVSAIAGKPEDKKPCRVGVAIPCWSVSIHLGKRTGHCQQIAEGKMGN